MRMSIDDRRGLSCVDSGGSQFSSLIDSKLDEVSMGVLNCTQLHNLLLKTGTPAALGSGAFAGAAFLHLLLRPAHWKCRIAVCARCKHPAHTRFALQSLRCRSRASESILLKPLCDFRR